ncbi:Acyl carrier protein [bioreactor metagenome]|uniref:Acyl carrier protein n=1 Tax=bioreactor metagenome TaxID=1076179 RepID=A0A644VS00_9ZZZZ
MNKNLKSPKEIVAKALDISVDQLNEDSAYGKTPNWDSLNHVSIINELEANYGIQISDSEIENYLTMKAIIQLYEKVNK